ncbi:DNA repair protein RAD51 homolog 4 isoform X3 [Rosa rugosa]|uniref:DNA repair protein RAD51 homolog 4 isoform X3 n=1 Tax=Rosa rugosa TaxID=74645 RepID=UPI002B40ACFD|nr:DNA repair protein RAD51 homolog 4 isoform X3 [Rosa rugosa]
MRSLSKSGLGSEWYHSHNFKKELAKKTKKTSSIIFFLKKPMQRVIRQNADLAAFRSFELNSYLKRLRRKKRVKEMAPFKALELEYPIIDSNFQTFCASHGILSVEDFLIHDLYELAAFAKQQPTSEKLEQGITQILSIIDAQHQPWVNGMQLLDDALHRKHVIPTGCEGVDLLLGGGLLEGQLTELVGPSSSGKTQVCLLAASYLASKHMGTVVYLDTGNSFSTQRIAEFVGRFSNHMFSQAGQRNFQKVMNNILCHSVFDIFTMFNVLHQLEFNLKSQLQKGGQVRLLIVDSISSLITPILGNIGSQGRALMTSAGYLLKKLAHEHNIVVLVTNHTVGGERGIPKPALGQIWKTVAHVRLLLSADHGNDTRSISVLKHPSMASGKVARFRV